MDYTSLGRSGIRVSRIGIGTFQASPDAGRVDDREIVRAIQRSYELGVNLIDTAERYGYGYSERLVGRAVREIGRDNLVIATKVYGPHLRYEELQKACNASLERLGVKQIDLYQVHWPDPWEQIPLKHTMRALGKLYNEGRIRSIGVSNFAVRDLEEAQSSLSKAEIVSNQVRYNLIQGEIEEEVLPYCRRNGISILAHTPIAQGALTGKYSHDSVPGEAWRAVNLLFSRHNMLEIEKLLAVLSRIGIQHNKTVAQVALRWLIKDPLVTAIPGARNPRQAEENAGAAGWELGNGELVEIEKVRSQLQISYFPGLSSTVTSKG